MPDDAQIGIIDLGEEVADQADVGWPGGRRPRSAFRGEAGLEEPAAQANGSVEEINLTVIATELAECDDIGFPTRKTED